MDSDRLTFGEQRFLFGGAQALIWRDSEKAYSKQTQLAELPEPEIRLFLLCCTNGQRMS